MFVYMRVLRTALHRICPLCTAFTSHVVFTSVLVSQVPPVVSSRCHPSMEKVHIAQPHAHAHFLVMCVQCRMPPCTVFSSHVCVYSCDCIAGTACSHLSLAPFHQVAHSATMRAHTQQCVAYAHHALCSYFMFHAPTTRCTHIQCLCCRIESRSSRPFDDVTAPGRCQTGGPCAHAHCIFSR
jgi:hypothetical protein